MSSVQRKLGINVLWNTLNTWGGTVLTLASTIVYARLLASERWGVYATFTWLVTTFALLINLGWNLTINKFVAEASGQGRAERGARVLQLVLAIEAVGALVLGGLALLFTRRIAAALGRPEVIEAMPLILLGMAALVVQTTCTMGLIALQRYKAMSIRILVTSSLALAAGVLWLRNGGDAQGLVAITAVANTLNAAICLTLIGRELPIWSLPVFDRALFAAMGRYSLAGTLILVLTHVVFERVEVFFLNRSQPVEQVGYYSLAVAMTNIAVNSVPNIVIGPLLAMSAELHSRDDWAGLRQLFDSATRLLTLVAPPVGIGGALVAWPLVRLLYGEQYSPVAIAAMFLLLPATVTIVTRPATSVIWGIGAHRLMLRALIPGAALTLTLDALLIPRHGLYGAVVASGCAQIATTLWVTRLCLRHLGFTFPWSRFARTTLAACGMVPFGLVPTLWLDGAALLASQVAIGAIVYPVGLVLLRQLGPEDVALVAGVRRRLPGPLRARVAVLLAKVAGRA